MTAALKNIALVLLTVAACLSLLQGLNNAVLRPDGSQDNQWGPSRLLLQRKDPYAPVLHPTGPYPYILAQVPWYPASGLVFLWPYAVWPWPAAKALWAASNLAFTGIIVCCLLRFLPASSSSACKLAMAASFVAGTPWRNGVGNGQHALFALAFLLVAVVALGRGKAWSFVPLAISWFKYTITFPLSMFFARGKRGTLAIAAAAGIHAALTILLALWIGAPVLELLTGPVRVASRGAGNGYLDVFAVASRLGIDSRVVPAVAGAVILGITWLCVTRDDDELSCLSTLSLAALAALYHRGYDFVALVIPLAYVVRERAATTRAKLYLAAITLVWFVDKAVDVAAQQAWFAPLLALLPVYFFLEAAVLYSALGLDWLRALKLQPAQSSPHPAR